MVNELFSFKILSYLGVWRPESWTSKWSIRVYNIYNFFMLIFEYYYALTFLISVFQNIHNKENLLQNIFFFSSIFILAFKVTYFTIFREEIISFTNMFHNEKYLPRNEDEVKIYKTFVDSERFNSRIFVICAFLTTTLYTSLPLTSSGSIVSLPYISWIPFATNSRKKFWAAYLYECISAYVATLMFSAMETLPPIMMQQINIQLEIFNSRLLEIPKLRHKKYFSSISIYREEYQLMKDCIDHHDFIFLMEKQLNNIFSLLITVQFFVSTLNLCTSGFYMTKVNIDNAYFWLALINVNTFVFQIFLYCWFGDAMTRKSLAITNEIYNMDWSLLDIKTKRTLMIIMMRASRPIQLSGSSVIIMSIETFLKILKSSYSAYNLIRNSS